MQQQLPLPKGVLEMPGLDSAQRGTARAPQLKGRYPLAEQVQMHFSVLPGRSRRQLTESSLRLFLLATAATCQHKSLLARPSTCEHLTNFALLFRGEKLLHIP